MLTGATAGSRLGASALMSSTWKGVGDTPGDPIKPLGGVRAIETGTFGKELRPAGGKGKWKEWRRIVYKSILFICRCDWGTMHHDIIIIMI